MNGNGIIMYESNSLAHYGVLGMKWGVRRYQNKDGTLTSAGKKHYGNSLNKRNQKIIKAESYKQGLEFLDRHHLERDTGPQYARYYTNPNMQQAIQKSKRMNNQRKKLIQDQNEQLLDLRNNKHLDISYDNNMDEYVINNGPFNKKELNYKGGLSKLQLNKDGRMTYRDKRLYKDFYDGDTLNYDGIKFNNSLRNTRLRNNNKIANVLYSNKTYKEAYKAYNQSVKASKNFYDNNYKKWRENKSPFNGLDYEGFRDKTTELWMNTKAHKRYIDTKNNLDNMTYKSVSKILGDNYNLKIKDLPENINGSSEEYRYNTIGEEAINDVMNFDNYKCEHYTQNRKRR